MSHARNTQPQPTAQARGTPRNIRTAPTAQRERKRASHPRGPMSEETRRKLSEAQQMVWRDMPAEESEARRALLRGLWELPGRKERLSQAMRDNWAEYKRSPRWHELYSALVAARFGEEE